MTDAIIITLIIVSSIIALAWLVLHFGYKAWRAEREEIAAAAAHVEALKPNYEYSFLPTNGAPIDVTAGGIEVGKLALDKYPFGRN